MLNTLKLILLTLIVSCGPLEPKQKSNKDQLSDATEQKPIISDGSSRPTVGGSAPVATSPTEGDISGNPNTLKHTFRNEQRKW